ncbi:MAG: cytochrome c [Acidimicrobiia bacterium]|nr:cytochrome c [Acidimicrobiia bacterium]
MRVGLMAAALLIAHASAGAQGLSGVTFTKDIAPILQRSCQNCHRPNSVAPMSLMTYEEVRPFARAIRQQTALRQMPPWYIEKAIGIQAFLDDPSLSDEEIAAIAAWVDAGAPEGPATDLPPARSFPDTRSFSLTATLGPPDLVVSSPEVLVKAGVPDWWGAIGEAPSGLTEDRYIKAVEHLEVNDVPVQASSASIGGRFLFHHAAVNFVQPDGTLDGGTFQALPVHEVGRNADLFDPAAGRLIRAGALLSFANIHLHANDRDSKARLDVALWFHPRGYRPAYDVRPLTWGQNEIDLDGNTADQVVEAFYTLQQPIKLLNYEPHMHAAGVRMCLEAIWGPVRQMLNCAGYNHNWVRAYTYHPDSAPLLPAGTILRIVGYNDTTAKNPNVLDPRNWSGWGHRSVDNMLNNLAYAAFLTPEQFETEVAARREKIRRGEAEAVGCLTCGVQRPPQSAGR